MKRFDQVQYDSHWRKLIRALLDTDVILDVLSLDAIVTRNLGDYAAATIPAYLPAQFLAILSPAAEA